MNSFGSTAFLEPAFFDDTLTTATATRRCDIHRCVPHRSFTDAHLSMFRRCSEFRSALRISQKSRTTRSSGSGTHIQTQVIIDTRVAANANAYAGICIYVHYDRRRDGYDGSPSLAVLRTVVCYCYMRMRTQNARGPRKNSFSTIVGRCMAIFVQQRDLYSFYEITHTIYFPTRDK